MARSPTNVRLVPVREAIEHIAWPGKKPPHPSTSLEALEAGLAMSEPDGRLLKELRAGKISAYGEHLRPEQRRSSLGSPHGDDYFRGYIALVQADHKRRGAERPKLEKIPAAAWREIQTSWAGDQFVAPDGTIYRNIKVPEQKIRSRWQHGLARGRPKDSAETEEHKYGRLTELTLQHRSQGLSIARATAQACEDLGYYSESKLRNFRRHYRKNH